nr:response regulator [Deltaproteobacteria bacterium]
FVPRSVLRDAEPRAAIRHRATALTLLVLALTQTGLGVAYLALRMPGPLESGALLFGWAYPFALLAWLPRTQQLQRLSITAAALALVATVGLVSVTGGIDSPALPLFAVVPSGGFAIGGRKAVGGLALATTAAALATAAASFGDWLPANPLGVSAHSGLRTLFIVHAVVLIGMSSVSTSISRRHSNRALLRARKEAEQASVAKSRFLAVMSHELRTPMAGLLGTVELLGDTALDDDQREHVDVLRASGGALLTVLNDVLDFSRIEAGRLELRRDDFDPHDLAEQVRRLFAPVALNRGLTLTVESEGLGYRYGDDNRLRQIITNLVGNALKFTEEGGVTLRVSAPSDTRLRVEVRDTGIGISPEDQARLFQPFSQVDAGTTRTRAGSGLGLAICRSLIEAMGGAIEVRSTVGHGSTFSFEVPCPLSSTPDPEDVSPLPPRPAARPLRILVAEDNEIAAMVVRRLIERQGHEVDVVVDGARAVAAVKRHRYDLVFMDMHMPVMDGPEATRQIRALPGPSGTLPVYGLSADAVDEEARDPKASGLDGFLLKPVDMEKLATVLDEVGAEPGLPATTGHE